LLATIYVAIVVPFNASFPDTFDCNVLDISPNDNSSIFDVKNVFVANNTLSTTYGETSDVDDQGPML
jgi:hypothetical protein